jgi:hypothetical protein
VTEKLGDTQNNVTQVNIFAHVGVNENGELNEITPEAEKEITRTGTHEDNHVGGVPDTGKFINLALESEMVNDPQNIIKYDSKGTNALDSQRSLILKTAEENVKQ